jgi:hypothetical protein
MRVEPSSNPAALGNNCSHEFTEDVGDDGQEDDGDEDGLGLEVVDASESRAEERETNTQEPHTECPRSINKCSRPCYSK